MAEGAGRNGVATRIDEITLDVQLKGVEGAVQHKKELRPCRRERDSEALGGPSDDGPLADIASKVLNVTIFDRSVQPRRNNRITVFFYDVWAERLSFLLNQKHKLIITGPSTMVRRNEHQEANDNPYLLVVAPPAIIANGTRQLRSRMETASTPLSVTICGSDGGAELSIEDPEDPDLERQVKRFVDSTKGGQPAGRRGEGASAARGGAGSSGCAAAGTKYVYKPLQDATTDQDSQVDVYAVVASFSLPKKTSGSDMILSVLLVDPSQPDVDQGCVINIFAPDESKFPLVTRVGDILRCHRAKVQIYQNKPQLVGFKQRSQFVVFSRSPDAPLIAPAADLESVTITEEWDDSNWIRQATSQTHTFDEDDQKQVYRLWAWSRHWLANTKLINPEFSTGPLQVQSIITAGSAGSSSSGQQGHHSDLVAMIVGKTQQQLYLWDGTGSSTDQQGQRSLPPVADALVDSVHTAIQQAMAGPKWAELAAAKGLPVTEAPPTREDVSAALSLRQGARLSVRVSQDIAPRLARYNLAPGMWVRAKDMQVLSPAEGAQALITNLSSLNALPITAFEVAGVAIGFLKRMLQHKKDSGQFPVLMPYYKPRRVVDPPSGPRCAHVAEAMASSPGTFHVYARIAQHWPTSASQLCQAMPRPASKGASRRAGGVLEWRFFFELVLQDDTGTINTVVADEVAEFLFPSVTPCDLADPANADHRSAIEKALAKLRDAPPHPLMVKSYLLSKRDKEGKTKNIKRFRLCSPIFNTQGGGREEQWPTRPDCWLPGPPQPPTTDVSLLINTSSPPNM